VLNELMQSRTSPPHSTTLREPFHDW
jgi:hypothetical protein